MTFAEWDQEIQAFPPNRPHQALTECVRLGRSNRTRMPKPFSAVSKPEEKIVSRSWMTLTVRMIEH